MVKHSLALASLLALFLASAEVTPVQAQEEQSDDFAVGVAAYHSEDYAKAFEAWLPLAEDGDNAAQYNLGILYQYGLGVPQDVSEAVKWYMKSADAGFADAAAHLGDLYAKGFFGEPDDASAIVWYEKASKQGHAGAETKLAAAKARLIPEVPSGSQGGGTQ